MNRTLDICGSKTVIAVKAIIVQIGFGAHPASYLMGTRIFSSGKPIRA
jgi:hypothetical protein